jgi:hypothetical protein
VVEEASKAAPIPTNVSLEARHELAVTALPPDFSIRMEALRETTLPAVKKMTAVKQEEEAEFPVAGMGGVCAIASSDGEESRTAAGTPVRGVATRNGFGIYSLPRAVVRRNRRGAHVPGMGDDFGNEFVTPLPRGQVPRIKFEALPLTGANQESSSEDKTASMDTCDKDAANKKKEDYISVYEGWEMRM